MIDIYYKGHKLSVFEQVTYQLALSIWDDKGKYRFCRFILNNFDLLVVLNISELKRLNDVILGLKACILKLVLIKFLEVVNFIGDIFE